jgi:hypothetical protein
MCSAGVAAGTRPLYIYRYINPYTLLQALLQALDPRVTVYSKKKEREGKRDKSAVRKKIKIGDGTRTRHGQMERRKL